eukprot:CAMPEP_0194119636 /NCGR_PEP_ID=MMETSP0150-20130528/40323_1 /TAXON_ID=122233 /ORGANISM="Chaetoceros debilis, Strain MM31A-1" /LENGTH=409 /DNA_ID=CAMNT_0038811413 /DNA_START=54 /DNA_END=1280 /DNA_ORIENTATION=+
MAPNPEEMNTTPMSKVELNEDSEDGDGGENTNASPTPKIEELVNEALFEDDDEGEKEEAPVKESTEKLEAALSETPKEEEEHVIHEHEHQCPLQKAEELYNEESLLEAARVLKSITDPNIALEEKHHSILRNAEDGEALFADLKAEAKDGDGDESGFGSASWIDHGVSGGKFPTRILHRLEETSSGVQLRVRCETPIQKELLSPLLSVLNESQLYKTWMPRWTAPRFQLRTCEKLKQMGRVSQILHIVMDIPWPMASREFVLSAVAFDDIEANGDIGIKLKSITTADNIDDCVPEKEKKSVEVDLDGGFLFTKCPKDHPTMEKVKKDDSDSDSDADEDMVLVRFGVMMNPNMKLLPQSMLNFLVKVAMGTVWKMMLGIAVDIKDGKRPDHTKAIDEKEGLYSWVSKRLE